MDETTRNNLYTSFVGEAKAHFRLLAYAERAEAEGYERVALLFRAVAEAERVHASRSLRLLGEVAVKDTEANLEDAFQHGEATAAQHYVQFSTAAEAVGETATATAFSQMRDVENQHAALYRHALQFLLGENDPSYHVCQVCGYVAEGPVPDACPICGADASRFRRVD